MKLPVIGRLFAVIFSVLAGLAACSGGDPSVPAEAQPKPGADGTSAAGTVVTQQLAAAAVVTWTKCANEDEVCSFTGTKTIRYGLNGTYAFKTATDSIACNNQVFGDPLPYVYKICEYSSDPPPPTTWVRCAVEDTVCTFTGTRNVRFGANGAYFYKTATGSIECSNMVFGDPAWGVYKGCDYGDTVTAQPTDWTHCAAEGQVCTFTGTREVRYGANGAYNYKTATGSIECSNAVFGDPAYNVYKGCDYGQVQTAPSALTPLIAFPIVPVAAANLPNGKILTWSAYSPTTFGGDHGMTYSALFDPVTQAASSRVVSETGHDMFCPGTSLLADGRLLVNGGSSSQKTSIYNPASDTWTASGLMNTARGYQGNATLSNGAVLTLGGSWSGPVGGKNGEIWTNGSWRSMSGIPIAPFIGPDPAGVYRGDNHLWLFAQENGKVFHAGPSANMNWIETTGDGNVTAAGTRGDDVYSMNGNAVMYDIGKILKTGGATAYQDVWSSSASYVIDIRDGTAKTRKIAPLNYMRALHNSVVLPNGQVVISGGQSYVKLFSDERSVLTVEIWDPSTETFTNLSALAAPRNYHSFSLLLPDGRVLIGGGGLCDFNCTTNHLDAQILTPPYLLNADGSSAPRPSIVAAPTKGTYGGTASVTADSAITAFALMRLGSVTHSLNNDQRRVPLQFSAIDATHYSLQLPANSGIAPPGYYMLFALNANGVPSVSKIVQIQ